MNKSPGNSYKVPMRSVVFLLESINVRISSHHEHNFYSPLLTIFRESKRSKELVVQFHQIKQHGINRVQIVTAFACSALASNWQRTGKPFNPLLGETFELERDGYRFICEQVSHHPPISAFHAESDSFVFRGWVWPKLKLWGKSVAIHPKGSMKLFLKKFKENYTWTSVDCTVHNVIVGKLWIEHHGTMEVNCPETNLKVSLHFKPSGWFNNELHRIEGFVLSTSDSSKKTKYKYLYGKWTETLRSTDLNSYDEYLKNNAHKFRLADPISSDSGKKSPRSPNISPSPGRKMLQKFNSLSLGKSFSTSVDAGAEELSPENNQDDCKEDSMPRSDGEVIDIPNSITLWEVNPRPEVVADYYHFTLFAMSLNEAFPNMQLAPTDSRFRPDIRKMEEGDLEGSTVEKTRLEEQQRKTLKNKNTEIGPQWFKKVNDDWEYVGGFWQSSKSSNINLFGK